MNEELKKRLLSLLWGAGISAVVAFLAVVSNQIQNVGLPEIVTLGIILICQQVTKFLNNKYQLGKRVLGAIKKS